MGHLHCAISFEINNENPLLWIGVICTMFDNFPRCVVGLRVSFTDFNLIKLK